MKTLNLIWFVLHSISRLRKTAHAVSCKEILLYLCTSVLFMTPALCSLSHVVHDKYNRLQTQPLVSPLSSPGTTVMTMMAFDADDPATDNAALRYNIVRQSPDNPSSNMFYIDAERGDIVTAISPVLLDREVGRL